MGAGGRGGGEKERKNILEFANNWLSVVFCDRVVFHYHK